MVQGGANVAVVCYLLTVNELSGALGLDAVPYCPDKNVIVATVGDNEAEPLIGIEPLA
jgi:hypothetical protein